MCARGVQGRAGARGGTMRLVVAVIVLSISGIGCVSEPPPAQVAGNWDMSLPSSPPFSGDLGFFPSGPPPEFGPTVEAATPPPALSGGTLLVLHGGNSAVAADPD